MNDDIKCHKFTSSSPTLFGSLKTVFLSTVDKKLCQSRGEEWVEIKMLESINKRRNLLCGSSRDVFRWNVTETKIENEVEKANLIFMRRLLIHF